MRRVLCLGRLRRTSAGWSVRLVQVIKLSPFRAPARNGAFYTWPAAMYPCALCGYPHDAALLSPCWSCEAWSRTDRCVRLDAKRPVRGLGEPQQAAPEYRKRYSGALLAYVRVYSLNLPFVYVIIHTKLRRRIGICGGDTELLRGCFHEIS